MTWDSQQCGMWDQQRLRPACTYAVWSELLLVAWLFFECSVSDRTSFKVSKLKRWLDRLVWVYTCQNTTLLEITCHGSFLSTLTLLAATLVGCWIWYPKVIVFTPGTTKGTVTLQKGHFKLALNDQKGHCKHALRDQKGHIYCLCSPPPPPTPTHQRDSYFPLYLLSLLPSQSNIPSFVPNLQKWMSLLKNCSPALNDLMFPVHLYGLCSSQNLTFILCSHFSKKMSLFPPQTLGFVKGK